MKTIKLFLGSSDELVHERRVFSRIAFELGSQLRERGMWIDLVKWEYLDSSMGPLRKQEEYNRELVTCDIVFVLFWRRLGEYTEEEFRMAMEGLRNRQRPRKVVVMFKKSGEAVEPGLVSFRESLVPETGLDVMGFANDDEFCQKAKAVILQEACLLDDVGGENE